MLDDTKLYMAGGFVTIGNVASTGQTPIAAVIAYLDTTTMSWTSVATNGNGPIYDLAIHPTTGQLWAVGGMTLLAPTLTGTGGVAYFDDTLSSWTFPGRVSQFILTNSSMPVKAVAFDQAGTAYIGGSPSFSAGITVLHGLASLSSSNDWVTIGGGVCGGDVEDLEVMDNYLFVAGTFTQVNCMNSPINLPGFAVWDLTTSSWTDLGAFLSAGDAVYGLELTNFAKRNETAGLSDYLLVTGHFASFNGNPNLAYLAKWNGSDWLEATSTPVPFNDTNSYIFDASTDGSNLYIGGYFNGTDTMNVAKWDGSAWSNMLGGLMCLDSVCVSGNVSTVSVFYQLTSAVVTPVSWGDQLFGSINWKYWLIFLCVVVIGAAAMAILTNCCWSLIACCRSNCLHSKPRPKEPGL